MSSSNSPHAKLRAVSSDPLALKAFIREEQAKRDKSAEEWPVYALFRPLGHKFYTHVVTPEGLRYRHEMRDHMPVFIGSPDTAFVEAVNKTAEQLGIPNRLVPKHNRIANEIEQAIFRGERVWERCPAESVWPAGYRTVDPAIVAVAPPPQFPCRRCGGERTKMTRKTGSQAGRDYLYCPRCATAKTKDYYRKLAETVRDVREKRNDFGTAANPGQPQRSSGQGRAASVVGATGQGG